ncbi:hypothetical protein DRP05_13925 [Archaeoglobales archaeon]|nr:MAG: hypothetical protein DRP05_13925 [Archaeoglobales archaeon]
MPKLVEALEEDVDRIYANVTPADVRKINALLKTKEFKGLSDLVRKAIDVLYLQYVLQGKIESDETILISRREITVE